MSDYIILCKFRTTTAIPILQFSYTRNKRTLSVYPYSTLRKQQTKYDSTKTKTPTYL